jgi:hypothetical protein
VARTQSHSRRPVAAGGFGAGLALSPCCFGMIEIVPAASMVRLPTSIPAFFAPRTARFTLFRRKVLGRLDMNWRPWCGFETVNAIKYAKTANHVKPRRIRKFFAFKSLVTKSMSLRPISCNINRLRIFRAVARGLDEIRRCGMAPYAGLPSAKFAAKDCRRPVGKRWPLERRGKLVGRMRPHAVAAIRAQLEEAARIAPFGGSAGRPRKTVGASPLP